MAFDFVERSSGVGVIVFGRGATGVVAPLMPRGIDDVEAGVSFWVGGGEVRVPPAVNVLV